MKGVSLQVLNQRIIQCDRCPRLRRYCQKVAHIKRRAYAECEYWARPVPGFGDPGARLWIIGLAPAAHGANRTGRMFTGDRSGDFLFAALHRAGYANQPASLHRNDGLVLQDCYISAAVRCAPPGNKPLPAELSRCSIFLDREWDMLRQKRVVLALGRIAWDAAVSVARRKGFVLPARPEFSHGATLNLAGRLRLIGSYHVSQQNTFTGRLSEAMFDEILRMCRRFSNGRTAGSPP